MAASVTTSQWDTEVLNSDVPVLVDFWATWCGPCRMIGPSIDELSSEYAGKAKVLKLNVDEEGDIGAKYGVMSIPALLVFKGGQLVEQNVGAMPKPQIAAMLDRHI
ncbi:MAG: thioredoxin [Chthonomonas sp.]|nr:thioredoxin [Chthonomonas sp.]